MIISPYNEKHTPKTRFEEDDLTDETHIVWKQPTDSLTYVRADLKQTKKRTGEPPKTIGDTIGYAELEPGANPDETYVYRRIFYLKDTDRGMQNHDLTTWRSQIPAEAVDPQTIGPGTPGVKTPRAKGLYYNPLVPVCSTNEGVSAVEETMQDADMPSLTIQKSQKYAIVQVDWGLSQAASASEEQQKKIQQTLNRWSDIESDNPENKSTPETHCGRSLQEIHDVTLPAAHGCADELAQIVWSPQFTPSWS